MCVLLCRCVIHVGELLDAINRDFGSFENLKSRLSGATVAVQGSGWGWLVGTSNVVILATYILMSLELSFNITFSRKVINYPQIIC